MTPAQAIARMVHFEGTDTTHLPPFEESGIHDPGLEPFPPSRPAVTDMAKEKGEALGIKVKPAGNRRLQPVVDKFFYWLRASVLETQSRGVLVGEPDAGEPAAAARKRWRCSGTAISR